MRKKQKYFHSLSALIKGVQHTFIHHFNGNVRNLLDRDFLIRIVCRLLDVYAKTIALPPLRIGTQYALHIISVSHKCSSGSADKHLKPKSNDGCNQTINLSRVIVFAE